MHKRKLFCLVLALVMSLALCACSDDPSMKDRYGKKTEDVTGDDLELFVGGWLVQGEEAESDLGTMIFLNEDGTAELGGAEYEWTAARYEEMPEDLTIIAIMNGKKVVYIMEANQWEDDGVIRVDAAVFGGEEFDWLDGFAHIPEIEVPAWFSTAYGSLYFDTDYSYEPEIPLEFNEDGTCKIGGKTYNWSFEPYAFPDNDYYNLVTYDEDGIGDYRINVQEAAEDCGFAEVRLIIAKNNNWNEVGVYNIHPMMNDVFTSWNAFNYDNGLDDYISIYTGEVYICDVEMDWQIGKETTEDTFVVYAPSEKAPEYRITFTYDGDYMNAALEVMASGEVINYYSGELGYDPENPERIYYHAVDAIDRYVNNNSVYHPVTEERIEKKDVLAFVREQLTKIGDYKDAQMYLDNIVCYEDKLVRVVRVTEDKLGNVNESSRYDEYKYDETGALIEADSEEFAELFGIPANYFRSRYNGYDMYPHYDENGNIVQIDIGNVAARLTPVYENGQLVSVHYLTNSEEYDVTFTLDDAGRRVRIDYPQDGPTIYYYTDDGTLTGMRMNRYSDDYSNGYYKDRYYVVVDYTYGANGLIAVETRQFTEWDTTYTVTVNYTYDDMGNLTQKSYTSTSENYTLVREEHNYIYEDVFFYTGEVSE